MVLTTQATWQDWPHVLSGKQFSRSFLEGELFPLAREMNNAAETRDSDYLRGKRVRLLFYEASERTLDSFISACDLLGAKYVWLGDPAVFSSQAKGESFSDMIRVVNCYEYDAIVIRSREAGEVAMAASVSRVPIINAGDGTGEHPTQAFLDAFSIFRSFGQIDGVRIALVGDLVYSRTIRSLAYMLPQWKVEHVYFVGPPQWRVGEDVRHHLEEASVPYSEGTDLEEVAPNADVVYLTRAQTERGNLPLRYRDAADQKVCITLTEAVLERMPDHAKVMHPLPRNDKFRELPEEFTDHPKVVIFDQVRNGLLIRMALLKMLLG
ncbi:MAG: aspartate carbamoyltransferase [Candidatus Woykebacteria bacterium GWB1_45_5]|uniref:Aspartate carbamoyltransferase n=2 Tax=Candidatus Woykeibacteriota TaxID=1817899 RepID=A0A1G1W360_9BACT|nr:MAG: aspartate carbamoyltransferase [Candidatus Woykebacteria bacterium GWA1_44_8]OGY23958.1 MAG: aspartate carbamoyltransferase [Candidatus Woykebacteria bacterium GWB1_45_5]